MIIYSEILDKQFDTVQECLDAELEFKRAEKEKERAKAEHEKKLNVAYDKAMKAIDEYLELAGITVEETKNGYKVIQRMTDEDADDIWDSILNALMN